MTKIEAKLATIKLETIGQNFGVCAVVYDGAMKVHVTDTYTFGADSAARLAAEEQARKLGLSVTHGEAYRSIVEGWVRNEPENLRRGLDRLHGEPILRAGHVSFADGSSISL